MKKILLIVLVLLFSIVFTSCKDKEQDNKGYDGRVFDISLNNDQSLVAKITKVGINYELVITGRGEAKTYSKKELVPWNAISKNIIKVVIEEGITSIGDYYFSSCTLNSYIVPSTVKKINVNSFNSNATIYSYSTLPIEENCPNTVYYYSETSKNGSSQYWHMVNGNPVIWQTLKVLFIGNSFTYYPYKDANPAVPLIFKSLADNLGLDVEIDFVVKGSHNLKKFADANDEQGKIVDQKLKASNDYDFVIIQEQSTTPMNNYNNFKQGVEALLNKVKATQENCQVVLYSTWGYPTGLNTSTLSTISAMEALIREGYEKCADEFKLPISYVGKAFTYVYDNHKNINLYWSDDKHQSYAGAYLSACVHISTLFGVDVRNATFNGELDQETATTLKNVAYNTVFK